MSDPYRIDMFERAKDRLKKSLLRLSTEERARARLAWKRIIRRLQDDPFEFGEELYDFKALGLQVRMGVHLPLVVQFGADRKNRLVIIQTAAVIEPAT
jgi:hypothetical protein